MAIQFARIKYISRSSGGNACRSAAYNERSRVPCERTGQVFNFSSREGNVFHMVLLPEGVDATFKNSTVLWNAAEQAETRTNSQVAKESVIALPDNPEITLNDRREIARRYAHEMFVSKGLAVQLDIHAPHEGEGNWHAHLLVTTRRFTDDGKALSSHKARDTDIAIRRGVALPGTSPGEIYARIQQDYFDEKGLSLRVDPIGIIPQEHGGPQRLRIHRSEALERARLLREANETLSKDPAHILKALTRTQSVFEWKDVERYVHKHVRPENQASVLSAVKGHRSLVPLYDPERGETTPYFTTHHVRVEEEKLLRFAKKVHDRGSKEIAEAPLTRVIGQHSLSSEQEAAVRHATDVSHGLSLIEGKAGTGKSYTMAAIRQCYEEAGYEVMGLAPTHQVAQAMSHDGFSRAMTLHSFLFRSKNQRLSLGKQTVLMVDEAGMVSNSGWVELFHVAAGARAKVIVIGDDRQLRSVERGGMFRELAHRWGSCEISEVRRQQGWQQEVSQSLASRDIKGAVQVMKEQGALVWDRTPEDSITHLVQSWAQDRAREPSQRCLVLAHRNVDVDVLNQALRDYRIAHGEISASGYTCQTQRGPEIFSVGDRVCLTKTEKRLDLMRGTVGEIVSLSPSRCVIRSDQGEAVSFDPETYHGMRLGYASTIHQAQGSTVDRAYVLHDPSTYDRLSYVALTRQRCQLKLFIPTTQTPSLKHLVQQMERHDRQASSLAFLTQAEHERLKRQGSDTMTSSLKERWHQVKQGLKDTFHHNADFYHVPEEKKASRHPLKAVTVSLETSPGAQDQRSVREEPPFSSKREADKIPSSYEAAREAFKQSYTAPSPQQEAWETFKRSYHPSSPVSQPVITSSQRVASKEALPSKRSSQEVLKLFETWQRYQELNVHNLPLIQEKTQKLKEKLTAFAQDPEVMREIKALHTPCFTQLMHLTQEKERQELTALEKTRTRGFERGF